MIDLWDIQVGDIFGDLKTSWFAPQSFQIPWLKQVRAHTKKPIVRIGNVLQILDCVAHGLVADAVLDGRRFVREIDTENPEVPLQFICERRVVAE